MTKELDMNSFLISQIKKWESSQEIDGKEKKVERIEFLVQALRDIEEVGSRHIYQSFEGEQGWEKKLLKIDRSIEADMAHDALASFEQWGEYV